MTAFDASSTDAARFKPLFRMHGLVTCLHTELLLTGSLKMGEPLALFDGEVWHTFLTQEGERRCLVHGQALFADADAYGAYASSYRALIVRMRKEILPRYARPPTAIALDEFEELLALLRDVWRAYGLTEFVFHDLAAAELCRTQDPTLAKNLADLGALKLEGRKLLNELIFADGPLRNALASLSARFLAAEHDACFLFSDELRGLFAGASPPASVIAQRARRYGARIVDGELILLADAEAGALLAALAQPVPAAALCGTVAQRGVASGRVIIAPMLMDHDAVAQVGKRMRHGDILVAHSTTPELLPLCEKAAAIVTDQGGMLSHAAIVSRELKIPCVIGTRDATRLLRDGDQVEVDAEQGIIRICDKRGE